MALLSKNQILESEDVQTQDLEIPEWDGTVRLRSLRGWERDDFEQEISENKVNARARLCSRVLVDENGDELFQTGDIKALGQKNAKALDRIFELALSMNGLSAESEEDLRKNSETAPREDSTSSSPATLEEPLESSSETSAQEN